MKKMKYYEYAPRTQGLDNDGKPRIEHSSFLFLWV